MAHEIEIMEDGTAAFFSNREVPWHNLGVLTDSAQTVDDALRLAMLDWTVYKSEEPVTTTVITENGVANVPVPDRFATYRDHPILGLQGLGVVGNQYTVIQNREAFDFLNLLADESGAVFETAGSLRGGTRVFMSMKMPQHISIADGTDTVDLYLICTTSHDGTQAFTVYLSAVRPVCANTVQFGLNGAAHKWHMKHTSSIKGKIQQARDTLGFVVDYADAFQQAVDQLVSLEMTRYEFQGFTESLLPTNKDMSTLQISRTEEARSEIFGLWNAPTQQNVANTRWAAFNAVTEWADWFKPVKAGKRDEDLVRAERVFSGGVEGIKQKAYALLSR